VSRLVTAFRSVLRAGLTPIVFADLQVRLDNLHVNLPLTRLTTVQMNQNERLLKWRVKI